MSFTAREMQRQPPTTVAAPGSIARIVHSEPGARGTLVVRRRSPAVLEGSHSGRVQAP
ncbi:hypothetical protein [Ornithinimicrobium kibberense]|uniref:hypothetical protein n=1 Tax=Ornithinimicrobium kibberense TaxID=282060 RepID=UPI00360E8037